MERLAKRLERFFLLFLFVNPVLDILSGIYLKLSQMFALPGVTPSLLVRMVVLCLFALYILARKNWKAVLVMLPIALAWLLSLGGELMFYYSIDFMGDLRYFVQFAYNIAVILVYSTVFRHSLMEKEDLLRLLNQAMAWVPLLISSYILVSFALNWGSFTYADRFGLRGFSAYFYSGNDITGVLMMLLPLAICQVYRLDKYTASGRSIVLHLLAPATTIMALLLIGTKTAFAAVLVTVAVMLGYAGIKLVTEKDRSYISRFLLILLLTILLFAVLMLFQSALVSTISTSWQTIGDPLAEGRPGGAVTALLSGRTNKLRHAYNMWQRTTPYSMLFGVGRGTQAKTIEMDIFEVVLYYGIFGAAAMLWLYGKLGIGFLIKAFKRFDLMGLTLILSLGLAVGYLVAAGHVLFSVTSGFYFAFLLVYAHLYYAPDTMRLKVL